MNDFNGKVAVITGGASGIGRALAEALLDEGAKVAIADVETGALEKAVAELSERGEVIGVQTDVTRPESLDALADEVYAELGGCHLLFNNAGVSVANLKLWETEASDWTWVHGVNVHGVVNGVRAFVPRMIASGEECVVVNTSSGDGGIAPLAGQVVYASSKAAVSILTECLAAQLAGEGVNVRASILYPSGGMLATGIWTTKRNRPAELARKQAVPEGSETTFEDFMDQMKQVGVELPVQDLGELARHALEGIRKGEFVIMIGRESMEEQLTDRAQKLARGECPTVAIPGM
jgi:NAD(P)-dependent dehydrogenase (short-subunit alcohol dehydrogenase family)